MDDPPALEITPPFGYGDVVPMRREDKVALVHGRVPDFGRTSNALPVTVSEFNAAGRDYPIAFTTNDGGRTFAPLVIVGLGENENLFVDANGAWDAAAYIPLYLRRYPFCISRVYTDGQLREERLVCVVKSHLDTQGYALYGDDGQASAYWQGIERLLKDYENDLERTVNTCSSLAALGLFSPFQFKVTDNDEAALTMQGIYRIDEKKLTELESPHIKNLMTTAILSSVYSHFHSLENFGKLYSRALRRAQARLTAHALAPSR